MDVIPAIDLLDGKCVRLNQGDYGKVTQFASDPIAQAQTWQGFGAKRIHIVDLDAARTGEPINDSVIKKISESVDIPIQLGGGIRTYERGEELLGFGIANIILGTIAIENPDLVQKLAQKFPKKVSVGIDAKEGKVATRGWLTQSKKEAMELARDLNGLDLASVISTDISTDGTLQGPNLHYLEEIANVSTNPVIASGGIGNLSDLAALLAYECKGIKGVIVGRALYDGSFSLEEAIDVASRPILTNVKFQNQEPIA